MSAIKIKRVANEPLKYWVSSSSEADWHQVDMTQRGGHGICTCGFFPRCIRNLRRNGFVHVPYMTDEDGKCANSRSATECKHIRVARERVEATFLRPMLAMMADGIAPDALAFIQGVTRRASAAAGRSRV